MALNLPTSEEWSERCAQDGEFMLAARNWNGGIALSVGETRLQVGVAGGQPGSSCDDGNLISFSGEEAVWEKVLAQGAGGGAAGEGPAADCGSKASWLLPQPVLRRPAAIPLMVSKAPRSSSPRL